VHACVYSQDVCFCSLFIAMGMSSGCSILSLNPRVIIHVVFLLNIIFVIYSKYFQHEYYFCKHIVCIVFICSFLTFVEYIFFQNSAAFCFLYVMIFFILV
jgi:hypothetical protein